jgi:hypothetical protein
MVVKPLGQLCRGISLESGSVKTPGRHLESVWSAQSGELGIDPDESRARPGLPWERRGRSTVRGPQGWDKASH